MIALLLKSRLTAVWLLLMAATSLSFELGHAIGLSGIRHAAVGIILVAFVKARFVLLEFMELKHAPKALKLAAQIWLGVAAAAIVLTYLLTGSISTA